MDARPFRPRGAENAPHLLQQHKSAGNLAAMPNTTGAGFRGPAKRAAFGDMTNVSKQTGHARDEGKSIKVLASNGTNHRAPVNKENVVYSKDTLSRPAQRPTNLSTRNALENKTFDANKKTSRNSGQETYVRKDTHINVKAPAPSSTNDAPTLQPRHHKSQPQLKPQQQQASLRRTQSKQFEKSAPKPDVDTAAMSQEADYPYDQASYLDSMYLPIETGVDLDALQKEEYPEVAAKL
ncbi:cyclin B3, partial [Fusarium heterosporum]